LVKEVLFDYVPKEYFDRTKWGFSIPLNQWLLKELRFYAKRLALRSCAISLSKPRMKIIVVEWSAGLPADDAWGCPSSNLNVTRNLSRSHKNWPRSITSIASWPYFGWMRSCNVALWAPLYGKPNSTSLVLSAVAYLISPRSHLPRRVARPRAVPKKGGSLQGARRARFEPAERLGRRSGR
jgi:hypothetical protein